MRFKLVKNYDEWHLLTSSGQIRIVTAEEMRQFLMDINSVNEIESDTEKSEEIFDHYEGEPLMASLDGKTFTIYSADFLNELLTPSDFPYLTTDEFAEKHNRKKSIVLRMCRAGRIKGAVQKGYSWYIPKEAKYPEDKRAGRDMSKRYSK